MLFNGAQMDWMIEIAAVVALVVLVRKVLLPLCGRLSIWRARLYACGDVVQIGDTRGRVTHIGPLHTFLAGDSPATGPTHAISNAEVFRKTIVRADYERFRLWRIRIERDDGGLVHHK